MSFPDETLEALWAPWRFEYFSADKSRDFFKAAAEATDDAEHLVVKRGRCAFLMMNRYPYTVGHLMAVPYRKVADLAELTEAERLELFDLAATGQALLREAVRAQGFNVGLNIGECAGAGVADHLHLHVVPRWAGDTNFMPVLAGARIQPEALSAVYARLREALAARG